MKPVDGSVGAWIGPRLAPSRTITGVIPGGYARYVRVLHPIESDDEHAIRWRDVAAVTGRQIHPQVQWWRLIGSEPSINPSSELWPGSDPEIGELLQPDNQTLLDLLAHHTATPDDAYFAVWLGRAAFHYGCTVRFGPRPGGQTYSEPVDVAPMAELLSQASSLEHPGRNYGVLSGALEEAVTIPDLLGYLGPGPNIVWPADRSWCVATEVDFDSTLVGCSEEAARRLLDSPDLETLSIAPEDFLTYDADVVNTA